MKNFACLLSLFSLTFFWSCDEASFSKEALSIHKVLLASVKINNSSLDKTAEVQYPNFNFVGESFRSNLIAELSERTGGELSLVLPTESQEKILIREDLLFLKNNLNLKQYSSNELLALVKRYNADAYATLTGEANVWGQSLEAELKVFLPNGKLVWRQKLKAVSAYIIKDNESPYLSDYDEILDILERQKSHKGEITLIFEELGRNVAKSLQTQIDAYKKWFPQQKKSEPKIVN
jgi:hypothetical protein